MATRVQQLATHRSLGNITPREFARRKIQQGEVWSVRFVGYGQAVLKLWGKAV